MSSRQRQSSQQGKTPQQGQTSHQGRTSQHALCHHTSCCALCQDQGLLATFLLFVAEETCPKGFQYAALGVRISRDLGSLEDPNHIAWLTNTVPPLEFDKMAGIWRDWGHRICSYRRKGLNTTDREASPATEPPRNEIKASEKIRKDIMSPSSRKPPAVATSKDEGRRSALYWLQCVTKHWRLSRRRMVLKNEASFDY